MERFLILLLFRIIMRRSLLQILHQRELLMRIFQSIQRTATAVSPRVLTILGTTYDPGDNSYDGNTDSEANGADTSDTSSDGTDEDAGNYENPDSGSGEVVDDNDYSGTSDTDLDSSETEDTGSDGTDDIVEIN